MNIATPRASHTLATPQPLPLPPPLPQLTSTANSMRHTTTTPGTPHHSSSTFATSATPSRGRFVTPTRTASTPFGRATARQSTSALVETIEHLRERNRQLALSSPLPPLPRLTPAQQVNDAGNSRGNSSTAVAQAAEAKQLREDWKQQVAILRSAVDEEGHAHHVAQV